MNLQIKHDFATRCFDIFTNGDDLEVIVDQIEALMNEYGFDYSTANVTDTYITLKGVKVEVAARDRFTACMDRDITNVQQMKTILTDHINFLGTFISSSFEVTDIKKKLALDWAVNNILDSINTVTLTGAITTRKKEPLRLTIAHLVEQAQNYAGC